MSTTCPSVGVIADPGLDGAGYFAFDKVSGKLVAVFAFAAGNEAPICAAGPPGASMTGFLETDACAPLSDDAGPCCLGALGPSLCDARDASAE
jgi:hypothetical protein